MSSNESTGGIEREKNQSFELGHISQLESVAEDLRERSGDVYAQADGRREIEKAKLLKKLAREYEENAEKKRDSWEEKYDE